MATILVTGMAGGLAQRVAELLVAQGHEVVGVDYRPTSPLVGDLARVRVYQANYNKTIIEDVFKHHRFDAVLHLGRVGGLKVSLDRRFDLNVVGSQKIMNLCLAHKVARLVVLSTFHIYGAHPANHTPIAEDEPLRAGTEFPQLADAIQLDNMASTWVYQHRTVRAVVLRPTNVVGPRVHNSMSTFLRQSIVPHLLGFDPMMQFIHAEDLAQAVLAAFAGERVGTYNLAGRDAAPWRKVVDLARAHTFPLPGGLVHLYLRAASRFPAYLMNFFKYPCVITDQAFRHDFGWAPKVPLPDAIGSTVAEARSA